MTMLRWALMAMVTLAALPAHAGVAPRDIQYPPEGTPYVKAKQMLLKQGARLAPQKPEKPDARFPELDCRFDAECRAIFLYRDKWGWDRHVVIWMKRGATTIESAGVPGDWEALIDTPPPPAADIPKLSGGYLHARRRLVALGYRGLPVEDAAENCLDDGCKKRVPLPEAYCMGTGLDYCSAYWRAPDGRMLIVVTVGERSRRVYRLYWATREDRRDYRETMAKKRRRK